MINGIDIYHLDTVAANDLADMVKNNSLYFIFIKATTGGSGKDARFTDNWKMSRKAGLLCGAYHFFWPVTDATLQAINFVTQYKLVDRAGVLPPVVDIEWTKTNATQQEFWNQVLPAQRVPFIKEYLLKVESMTDVKPIIYTANSFWNEFISPNSSPEDVAFFSGYNLWIADPNNNGRLPLPWQGKSPLLTQNHLGDNIPATAPLFERLDNDLFNDDLKSLLNATVGGFTISKGFPFSLIVKDIQTALKNNGFLGDAPDGFFGDHTETALKAFQSANGFFENGIVDAQTWNKLL